MAVTKLSIINDALAGTSNTLIDQAGLDALDPSTPITDDNDPLFLEDRASRAYERELPLLLERHTWGFARATEALEQADEDDNPSNRFGFAYDRPFFALWLQKVEAPGGTPIDYEIVGNFICADFDGVDDDAPVATFIQRPTLLSDVSNLFFEILRKKVEVGILRTVNEDLGEAKTRDALAETALTIARTRTDQQTPARKAFRSTIRERRRSGGGPSAI